MPSDPFTSLLEATKKAATPFSVGGYDLITDAPSVRPDQEDEEAQKLVEQARERHRRSEAMKSRPADPWNQMLAGTEDAFREGLREASDQAARQSKTWTPAILREPMNAAAQVGADIFSTGSRPFSKEHADYWLRVGDTFGTMAEAQRQDDFSPWLSRMYGGAAQSLIQSTLAAPTGGYGMIGSFGATAGNRALKDAEDAGLYGDDRLKHAATEAAIEAGVAGVFQRLGIGGQEKMIADMARGAMAKTGIGFLKATAQEVPEELITEVLHAVERKAEGIDPNSLDKENLKQTLIDTTAQTIMAVGLGKAVRDLNPEQLQKAMDFTQTQSRRGLAALPETLKAPLKKLFPDDRKGMAETVAEAIDNTSAAFDTMNQTDTTSDPKTGSEPVFKKREDGTIYGEFPSKDEADKWLKENKDKINKSYVTAVNDGVAVVDFTLNESFNQDVPSEKDVPEQRQTETSVPGQETLDPADPAFAPNVPETEDQTLKIGFAGVNSFTASNPELALELAELLEKVGNDPDPQLALAKSNVGNLFGISELRDVAEAVKSGHGKALVDRIREGQRIQQEREDFKKTSEGQQQELERERKLLIRSGREYRNRLVDNSMTNRDDPAKFEKAKEFYEARIKEVNERLEELLIIESSLDDPSRPPAPAGTPPPDAAPSGSQSESVTPGVTPSEPQPVGVDADFQSLIAKRDVNQRELDQIERKIQDQGEVIPDGPFDVIRTRKREDIEELDAQIEEMDQVRYGKWKERRHRIGDHPLSFLTGHSSKGTRAAARKNSGLGLLITPHTMSYLPHAGDYSHIALDNGVYSEFTGKQEFSHEKFVKLLDSAEEAGLQGKTQFVVAPDRVGDWKGTLERSAPYYDIIREKGFPVAFAAQDGIEDNLDQIPWDQFDVLFIGGSTPWKLGADPKGKYKDFFKPTEAEMEAAGHLPNFDKMLREAKERGKKVHVGRVNSQRRMDYSGYSIQADTADGNFIGKAPDTNLPKVLGWLERTGGGRFASPSETESTPDTGRMVPSKPNRRDPADGPIAIATESGRPRVFAPPQDPEDARADQFPDAGYGPEPIQEPTSEELQEQNSRKQLEEMAEAAGINIKEFKGKKKSFIADKIVKERSKPETDPPSVETDQETSTEAAPVESKRPEWFDSQTDADRTATPSDRDVMGMPPASEHVREWSPLPDEAKDGFESNVLDPLRNQVAELDKIRNDPMLGASHSWQIATKRGIKVGDPHKGSDGLQRWKQAAEEEGIDPSVADRNPELLELVHRLEAYRGWGDEVTAGKPDVPPTVPTLAELEAKKLPALWEIAEADGVTDYKGKSVKEIAKKIVENRTPDDFKTKNDAQRRADALKQKDANQKVERDWNQLMQGQQPDLTSEEAQVHLSRLDEAPGDNPAARGYLESMIQPQPDPQQAQATPLTAGEFRTKMKLAFGNEEGDAQYQLTEARAKAAGETVDEYVGRRLADVRQSDVSQVGKDALHQTPKDLWASPEQEITSKDTSINNRLLPALFNKLTFEEGTLNVDIGGGRFDNVAEHLSKQGVENVVYDPFNRSAKHNKQVAKRVRDGQADTATAPNVLNVIREPNNRARVMQQAANAIGADGVAYFQIYEGNGTGKGRETSKGWQENRKTADYESEIGAVFGEVKRRGNIIEARSPVEGVLYQTPSTPWYMKSRQVIEEKMGNKALPGQVLGMLKKNGIKDEELEWSGLSDLLKGGERLTKQQALDTIDNGIELEEVTLGEQSAASESAIREAVVSSIREEWGRTNTEVLAELEDVLDRWNNDPYDSEAIGILNDALDDNANPDVDEWSAQVKDEMGEAGPQTKYERYTLPGMKKKSYRELLITMAIAPETDTRRKRHDRLEAVGNKYGYSSPEYRQASDQFVEEEKTSPLDPGNEPYKSSHYDQDNILAHIRFNEREDFTDGSRVMFLEEVQSDWHQEGRQSGYRAENEKKLRELVAERDALEKPVKEAHAAMRAGAKQDTTDAEFDRLSVIHKELLGKQRQVQDQINQISIGNVGVPNAPFKKTWPMLAMKRAIQYAAENGFDRVAWTTGETQAERYDLSKQVDEISYQPDEAGEDGEFYIAVRNAPIHGTVDSKGIVVESNDNMIKGKPLEDVVGKEIADRLLNGTPDNQGFVRLKDNDLKVGGEGMKAFYDKMLPSAVNKFVNKFGARVGETQINSVKMENEDGTLNQMPFGTTEEGDSVHSFDITPEMRESALKHGQPMFQKPKDGPAQGAIEFQQDGRAIIHAFESADASTGLHELFHLFRRDLAGNDKAIAEKWAKVKDGTWTREQEEMFSRGGERYLRTGKAPIDSLKGIFEKFKGWLKDIYKTLKGSPLDVTISKEMHGVYDRLFIPDATPQTDLSRPTKPLPELPKDNYRKPLSTYSDRLFHETDVKNAMSFIPGSGVTTTMNEVFVSNTSNLALGQRTTGVLLEFEPGTIEGKISKKKPNWNFVWDQGEAEFIASAQSQQSEWQDNLVSMTVSKDAKADPAIELRMKKILKDWTATPLPDGGTKYVPPGRKPETPDATPQTDPSRPNKTSGKKVSIVKQQELQPRYREWLETLPDDGIVPPNREFVAWSAANPATVKTKPVDTRAEGETDAKERPETTDDRDRPKISELGETGKTGRLILANESQSQEVQYVAVEADQIVPSHDARNNFTKNPDGDINERPYHDRQQGRGSREMVEGIAKVDPEMVYLLVTDDPTPVNGPPMATPHGTVLGGNARAMGMQLAYSRGSEAATRLKQTMVEAASRFEIDESAVKGMKQPVIVRVLSKVGEKGELSAILNESLTAAKSRATQAASWGSKVSEKTANKVSALLSSEDGRSLRDLMSDASTADELKKAFIKDGIWTDKNLEQYADKKGVLNEDGKTAIEQTLIGRAIGDPTLIGNASAATKQKTMTALGHLTVIMSDKTHGERFKQVFQNSVEALPGYRDSGTTLNQHFMKQKTITPFAGQGDAAVMLMVDALDTKGPKQFKNAMREISQELGIASQASLFGGKSETLTVDEAIRAVLGDGSEPPAAPKSTKGVPKSTKSVPKPEKEEAPPTVDKTPEQQELDDKFGDAFKDAFPKAAQSGPKRPKAGQAEESKAKSSGAEFVDKAKARKKRTSAKRKKSTQAFKDAAKLKPWKPGDDVKMNMGIDPKIFDAAVQMTIDIINDEISTFAEYIAEIAAEIGIENTQDFSNYFESAWKKAGEQLDHLDPAGKVSDIYPKAEAAPVADDAPEINSGRVLANAKLVVESKTFEGKEIFEVSGNTFGHKKTIKGLGGKWYGKNKVWTFRNGDPTERLAAAIAGVASDDRPRGDAGDTKKGRGPDETSAEDVERAERRRRADRSTDVRGTGDDFIRNVEADTQELIRRGTDFGIPEDTVNEQIEDVGQIMEAHENGESAIVLANAPGTGKTFVLGGVIKELLKKNPNQRIVYVTMNKDLISQIQKDLADYGVENVEFVTYTQLSLKGPVATTNSVLIMDEAHNVKIKKKNDISKRAGFAQEMMANSTMSILASATPFENPVEAFYLDASGLFDDEGGHHEWAKMFGADVFVHERTDYRTGGTITTEVLRWYGGKQKVKDGIAARDWMKRRGIFIQRKMKLPKGTVKTHFRKSPVNEYHKTLIDDVVNAYARAGESVEGKSSVSDADLAQIAQHEANTLKRLLEAGKVDQAINRTKELIAEGKQVTLFAETKAARHIGRYRMTDDSKGQLYTYPEIRSAMADWAREAAAARRMNEKPPKPPFATFIEEIARVMHEAGIDEKLISVPERLKAGFDKADVVFYTGTQTTAAAKKNLDAWKAGKKKILIATMAKGGTGLSLHSTDVNMPERVQIGLNLPWNATGVEQVSGRLARYGTARAVGVEWLFADNVPFEVKVAGRVGGRMRDMGAVVSGDENLAAEAIADFDFEDGFKPADAVAKADERIEPVEHDDRDEMNELYRRAEALEKGRTKAKDTSGGFFETPFPLAAMMQEIAAVGESDSVLEPSAGTGNLLRLLPNGTTITANEMRDSRREELEKKLPKATTLSSDFMELTKDDVGAVDVVLMNPPFEKAQDADHVQHAFEMLDDGGRLVAIMGEGVFFRGNKKETAFRDWLQDKGATVIKMPDNAFKKSGTSVRTRIVVLDKISNPIYGGTQLTLDSMDVVDLREMAETVDSRRSLIDKSESPAISRGVTSKSATAPEQEQEQEQEEVVNASQITKDSAAETEKGEKLFNKISNDIKNETTTVGMRSIVDFVNEAAHTVMFVGREQLGKAPAHFSGSGKVAGNYIHGPAIIRSRAGGWALNFHEAGHAISGWLRENDPKLLHEFGEKLIEVANLPGNASAITAEEGFAEVIRRYVVGQDIPADLWTGLKSRIKKQAPELLQALNDANRAYTLHRSRDVVKQSQANENDQPAKQSRQDTIAEATYHLFRETFGGDWVTHALNRKIFLGIADPGMAKYVPGAQLLMGAFSKKHNSQQKLARKTLQDLKNEVTDYEAAYQARMRISNEVDRTMGGVVNAREGVRVSLLSEGFDQFTPFDIKELEAGGFDITEEMLAAPYGEYIYMSDASYSSIKHKLKKDYPTFEKYAQYKAALSRYKKKGLDYPGRSGHLPPSVLEQTVKDFESNNPAWKGHFKEVQNLMDQMLLLGVLSGEHSISEAVLIRNSFKDYAPLPRQQEDGSGVGGRGREGKSPTSGVFSARGSEMEFMPLEQAVERRVRRSYEAYYENVVRTSILKATQKMNADKRLDYDFRKSMGRLMLPLKMDLKRVATLTAAEQVKIIASGMNRVQAEALGHLIDANMSDAGVRNILEQAGEEVVTPDMVNLELNGKPIFRTKAPNARNVVTTFQNGKLAYFQVTNQLLYNHFKSSKSMNEHVQWVTTFFGKPLLPWKRAITQSLAFAFKNVPRDATTAILFGSSKQWKSMIPGMVMSVAIVNRLKGDPDGHRADVSTELLSKSLDHTQRDAHGTLRESFFGMLGEGITDIKWGEIGAAQIVAELPGAAASTIMKPADIVNFISGGRYMSTLTETLSREGAFILSKQEGNTTARATREFDRVTGQFIQRQPNADVAGAVRLGGFLNPSLQATSQYLQIFSDPDPKMRAKAIAVTLPSIAIMGGIAAALNHLMAMSMLDDDEEKEEYIARMKERTESDKLSTMSIGGHLRIPFDHGISGSVASFAYNMIEDWLLEVRPQEGVDRVKGLMKRTLSDIAMPTDLVHPWYQTAKDIWQNHSEFMDADIVPKYIIEKYPNNPELWTLPDVPETYNTISRTAFAKFWGVSPLKLQYGVRQVLTRDMSSAIALFGKEEKKLFDPSTPIVGSLMSREPKGWSSRSIRSVVMLNDRYNATKTTLEGMIERGVKGKKLAAVREALAGLELSHQAMLAVERIWKKGKAKGTQKDKDAAQREMTKVAVAFLGEGELPKHRLGQMVYTATSPTQEEFSTSIQTLKNMNMTLAEAEEELANFWLERANAREELTAKKNRRTPRKVVRFKRTPAYVSRLRILRKEFAN